jgi:hypothetical protein
MRRADPEIEERNRYALKILNGKNQRRDDEDSYHGHVDPTHVEPPLY